MNLEIKPLPYKTQQRTSVWASYPSLLNLIPDLAEMFKSTNSPHRAAAIQGEPHWSCKFPHKTLRSHILVASAMCDPINWFPDFLDFWDQSDVYTELRSSNLNCGQWLSRDAEFSIIFVKRLDSQSVRPIFYVFVEGGEKAPTKHVFPWGIQRKTILSRKRPAKESAW